MAGFLLARAGVEVVFSLPRAFIRAMVESSYMTRTEARIFELFRTLPAAVQRALVEQLSEATRSTSFYERMTAEQRAELEEGLAEIERGETVPAEQAFDDLAEKFGFSRA